MANNVPLVLVSAATVVSNGATFSTQTYSGAYSSGFSAILISLSGTPNVTVTQQCSIAGSVWHDPISSSGSALGAILTAGTSTVSYYIQFAPVIAPYNRIKIVAAADSTVNSVTIVQSEQSPV